MSITPLSTVGVIPDIVQAALSIASGQEPALYEGRVSHETTPGVYVVYVPCQEHEEGHMYVAHEMVGAPVPFPVVVLEREATDEDEEVMIPEFIDPNDF